MFKNEYQGGAFVEIFSAQGKDPMAKWKLSGRQSAIWKDFDKEVKSFVFVLEGSSQTNKMQLPKESRHNLGLIQRFLILQLYIPLGQDFSAELLISDLGNIKRRLYLSTVHKELSATPLHAKIPLLGIKRKIWCNLCIDVVSFTSGIFKGAVFHSLDGIIVSANCKLRKIYTMKLKPKETMEEEDIYGSSLPHNEPTDIIPRCCQITTEVQQITQVLDLTKLQRVEAKQDGRPLGLLETDHISSRGARSAHTSRSPDKSHIAFGSKVLGPPPATSRRMSSRASAETTRATSRHERDSQQLPTGTEDLKAQTMEGKESISSFTHFSHQRNKENVQETRKKEKCPHEYKSNPQDSAVTDWRIRRKQSGEDVGRERSRFPFDGSSLGHGGKEDKLLIQIHVPASEYLNPARKGNKSPELGEREALSDEMLTPDSFQEKTSKSPESQQQELNNDPSEELEDYQQNGSRNESRTFPEEEDNLYTYWSMPRSSRLFKPQSLDHSTVSFDGMELNSRGAQLEDDFYRSDDSLQESAHFKWTSSPKSSQVKTQSTQFSESPRSLDISRESTHSSKWAADSKHESPMEGRAQIDDPLTVKATDAFQKNLVPTRSLSPSRSRNETPTEDPILSRTRQQRADNKLRMSLSRKSLKEIPTGDQRLISDVPDYDWRNAQPNRLSASEMQMLASLKRQQNEELEDFETLHGLSRSQIDQCTVSMSTSSDDTMSWSCSIKPPVTQGCHYQTEMNPLAQSNPRDWIHVFSPPIVPSSHIPDKSRKAPCKLNQSGVSSCTEDDDGLGAEEEEEVLTLLYDPCLNCYFDPETGKYYELA
ncbi:protein CFAP20DC-like [Xenopus laevis]|uniref:Protein CFAP20DC-like n=1 Tax=Xenopus laevis TaxID=8355 RepID=A0A8J1N0V1_XENLA|nr:protein CFAP20DC-like [Xenopus laevis]